MTDPIKNRQAIERRIVRRIVTDAIKAGYSVSVDNGDEIVMKRSTSVTAIMAEVMSVDEEHLIICPNGPGKPIGSVFLVYGNDGWDVVCDYTANAEIEAVLAGANTLAERLEV